MKDDKTKIILIGILLLALLVWAYFPFSSEPETPEYTAEIERQEDNTKLVVTSNVGEINADKLWVEFECQSAIEISNGSGIVGDEFEYDPTKTFEGDYYSISGGEKGVPTYNIPVCVYYSYEEQDKLVKKEIIKYENPSVPFSTEHETSEYVAEIERQDDNKIMVKTINHAKINADKLWVEFEYPSAIRISNRSGIVGDIIVRGAIAKNAFGCDPTKTIEGDYYSISGGEKGVPTYSISVCAYHSYDDQDRLIKEKIIKYDNPNR